jgi:hypothetical protein
LTGHYNRFDLFALLSMTGRFSGNPSSEREEKAAALRSAAEAGAVDLSEPNKLPNLEPAKLLRQKRWSEVCFRSLLFMRRLPFDVMQMTV